MGRKRISEYAAKKIITSFLNIPYSGIQVTSASLVEFSANTLSSNKTYVVKVDQGVKRRFKSGLMYLNVKAEEVQEKIKDLQKKGFTQFIVEPYIMHDPISEKYLALEKTRDGIIVYFSKNGGVDIESRSEDLQVCLFTNKTKKEIEKKLGIDEKLTVNLIELFDKNYFSFLEINPLVVEKNSVYFIDVACEVDSAGEFFVNGQWTQKDFVEGKPKTISSEEKEIQRLASKSQASFTYNIINPNGSIFVLLSGGGASVVIADEIYSKGMESELANYGEYSGNPNAEETYLYTKSLLSSLLKSKSKKKVVILGGGVANFTDIRVTFKGIIQALSEVVDTLKAEKVKVFVRRGGPYQKEGLKMMSDFLQKENLKGSVHGPDVMLTDVVQEAINYLKQ